MKGVLDFWCKLSIFDESSQTYPKYWKINLLNFVLYCDAKHSDTLLNSSHVCCYIFLVAVVKNGYGLLDHGTLKSAASQENELIKWTEFFTCWCKFRKKANVNLALVKNGSDLQIIYGTLKSGPSHMIWLIKQIDSIIFRLTTNPLCIFYICWVSIAVVLINNVLL